MKLPPPLPFELIQQINQQQQQKSPAKKQQHDRQSRTGAPGSGRLSGDVKKLLQVQQPKQFFLFHQQGKCIW